MPDFINLFISLYRLFFFIRDMFIYQKKKNVLLSSGGGEGMYCVVTKLPNYPGKYHDALMNLYSSK